MRDRPSLARLVVRVELGRARIGLGRLAAFAAAFVDEALVGPVFGFGIVETQGRVEVGEGVLLVAERQIGDTAARIGLGRPGVEGDCRRKVLDRLLVLAVELIEQAAIVVGAWVGGVEVDRLLEVGQGIAVAPGDAVDVAAADIGRVIARIDLDRTVVVLDRLQRLVRLPPDERPVGIGLIEVRIELDRRREILDGGLVVAGAAVGRAAPRYRPPGFADWSSPSGRARRCSVRDPGSCRARSPSRAGRRGPTGRRRAARRGRGRPLRARTKPPARAPRSAGEKGASQGGSGTAASKSGAPNKNLHRRPGLMAPVRHIACRLRLCGANPSRDTKRLHDGIDPNAVFRCETAQPCPRPSFGTHRAGVCASCRFADRRSSPGLTKPLMPKGNRRQTKRRRAFSHRRLR